MYMVFNLSRIRCDKTDTFACLCNLVKSNLDSDKVSLIEESILSEITARQSNALYISLEEVLVSVLNARICSATTAKPLPASPALAASIEALRARRLRCSCGYIVK